MLGANVIGEVIAKRGDRLTAEAVATAFEVDRLEPGQTLDVGDVVVP